MSDIKIRNLLRHAPRQNPAGQMSFVTLIASTQLSSLSFSLTILNTLKFLQHPPLTAMAEKLRIGIAGLGRMGTHSHPRGVVDVI